jgi:hypothetical protein
MNASARRENLLACLDCALPEPTWLSAESTRRRPSALGWMLLTGLACSGAGATLAAELAAATTTVAPTAAAATPLAPLPPSLPAAATAAKPIAQTVATSPVKEKAPAEDKAKANTTWQTITGWISPPTATAKNPPQSKELNSLAARSPAGAVPGSSPARTLSMSASPSTTTVGRFDPELGPAGHVVTDADEQTLPAESMARVAPPRQFLTPEPEQQAEQSAVASDEPVSLVSWLSSYASGGHGHADACRDVCLTDNCCPTWEAQVDALFLWQGNIPSRPLYIDSVSLATVLDANQLYAPAAIAPRYALTYHRDDCRAIEVNYFQVWGFNAQQVVGPQTVAGDGAFARNNLVGPDYTQVSGALATSSANIQSLEVNLRRTDGGMIEWISGFRWLEWGQNLSLLDSITTADTLTGGDFATINTLNNLYGWQLGGDMMLWNAGRWLRVNGIAKAGVYYNHQAAQNTYYTDFVDPTADVSVASANDTVSFVGETGVNASLALTNWLSWRAGYTCFWLGGVAVPARQLGLYDATAGTTSVNTNGSVFLHGVNTGLEARW